jgi:hypothetical protein
MPLPFQAYRYDDDTAAQAPLVPEPRVWAFYDDTTLADGHRPADGGLTRVWASPTIHPDPILEDPDGSCGYSNVIYDAADSLFKVVYQWHNASDFSDRRISVAWGADLESLTIPDTGDGTNTLIPNPGSFVRGGHVIDLERVGRYHRLPALARRFRYAIIVGYDTLDDPAVTRLYFSNDLAATGASVELLDWSRDNYETLEPDVDGRSWLLNIRPSNPFDEYQLGVMYGSRMYGRGAYWPAGWEEPNHPQPAGTYPATEGAYGRILAAPDADDLATHKSRKLYGYAPYKRAANLYLAWNWVYQDASGGGQKIQAQLIWSADGRTWTRKETPRPVDFPAGADGSWYDGMVFPHMRPVLVSGVWHMVFTAWDGPHDTTERTGRIGMATIREDGFVGLTGDGTNTIRTVPFAARYDAQANADAAGGTLAVRVLDESGVVIEGFDYTDMAEITTDGTAHALTWAGGGLSALAGETVMIEALPTDATVYSFKEVE